MRNDYIVLILTHGRADKQYTLKTLKSLGYAGDYKIVIDNEDDTADEYYEKYGDRVVMFDKKEISNKFDTGDNFDNRKTIVYARNACFEIAKSLGYRYFLELDDDYTSFEYRFERENKLCGKKIKDVNKLFSYMFDFLDESGADVVALAQGGDFIGGVNSENFQKGILRKAMNVLFLDVEKRFDFIGRINEDVNSYVTLGGRGTKFFTVTKASIVQKATQSNSGGMTGVYVDNGTYLKSFYSVMFSPSCVKVAAMGDKHYRLHYKISWNNAVPKILEEKHKKTKGS